jgi:hypothetical protein
LKKAMTNRFNGLDGIGLVRKACFIQLNVLD